MYVLDYTHLPSAKAVIKDLAVSFIAEKFETKAVSRSHMVFETFFLMLNPGLRPSSIHLGGFQPDRWKKFIRDYIDPADFTYWFHQATGKQKYREISYVFKRNPRHKYGNCISLLSYKQGPGVPCLTLISRTSRFPSTSFLDLDFLALVSNEIEKHIPEHEVRWLVLQPQFSAFYGLKFFLDLDDKELLKFTKTYQYYQKCKGKFLDYIDGKEEKFQTANRIYKLALKPPKKFIPTLEDVLL